MRKWRKHVELPKPLNPEAAPLTTMRPTATDRRLKSQSAKFWTYSALHGVYKLLIHTLVRALRTSGAIQDLASGLIIESPSVLLQHHCHGFVRFYLILQYPKSSIRFCCSDHDREHTHMVGDNQSGLSVNVHFYLFTILTFFLQKKYV